MWSALADTSILHRIQTLIFDTTSFPVSCLPPSPPFATGENNLSKARHVIHNVFPLVFITLHMPRLLRPVCLRQGELIMIGSDFKIYHLPCGDLCESTCLDQAEIPPAFEVNLKLTQSVRNGVSVRTASGSTTVCVYPALYYARRVRVCHFHSLSLLALLEYAMSCIHCAWHLWKLSRFFRRM